MKKRIIMLLLAGVLVMSMAGCGAKNKSNRYKETDTGVLVDYGKSDIYSEEDMNEAVRVIQEKIESWKGCTMSKARYASDKWAKKDHLQWLNEIQGNRDYTQSIRFYADFHTSSEKEDLIGSEWDPDTEYKDYEFDLGREKDGTWEIVSWGK